MALWREAVSGREAAFGLASGHEMAAPHTSLGHQVRTFLSSFFFSVCFLFRCRFLLLCCLFCYDFGFSFFCFFIDFCCFLVDVSTFLLFLFLFLFKFLSSLFYLSLFYFSFILILPHNLHYFIFLLHHSFFSLAISSVPIVSFLFINFISASSSISYLSFYPLSFPLSSFLSSFLASSFLSPFPPLRKIEFP